MVRLNRNYKPEHCCSFTLSNTYSEFSDDLENLQVEDLSLVEHATPSLE